MIRRGGARGSTVYCVLYVGELDGVLRPRSRPRPVIVVAMGILAETEKGRSELSDTGVWDEEGEESFGKKKRESSSSLPPSLGAFYRIPGSGADHRNLKFGVTYSGGFTGWVTRASECAFGYLGQPRRENPAGAA